MSRMKSITISVGSLAAGAALATGVTGMALAADTTPSPTSSSASTSGATTPATEAHDRHGPRGPGGPGGSGMFGAPGSQVLHGETVVKAADGSVSTVLSIRGTVTAVTATSITVKAEDDYTATFAVTSSTVVHTGVPTRPSAKHGSAAPKDTSTIADVNVGDVAGVHGTTSGSTNTATGIHAMTAAEAAQAQADRLAHEQSN